jgi:hypothetical protein
MQTTQQQRPGNSDCLAEWKKSAEVFRRRIGDVAKYYPEMFARCPNLEPTTRQNVGRMSAQIADFLSQIAEWLDRVPEPVKLGVELNLYQELTPILAGAWIASVDLAFENRGIEPSGPIDGGK